MSDDASPLRYHVAIFELLGTEPRVSEEALRRVERREAACGARFPASVREWYSLDGAEELLRRYSGDDEPVPLDQMGSPEEVRSGFLHVMTENQGVAIWCVRLHGSDDPPVDVFDDWSEEPENDRGDPWSSSFSAYVFDVVADAFIDAWFREFRVAADDRWPDEADLALLRSRLKEGPRTSGGGDRLTTYRFFDGDGLVTFQGDPDEVGEGEPRGTWCVRGRTEEGLYNLCRVVWSIGSLSATLASDCHTLYDNRADEVLRRLGRTIEPRPRPPVGWANPEYCRETFRAGLLASAISGAWLLGGWLFLVALFQLLGRWGGRTPSIWGLTSLLGGVWAVIVFFALVAPAIGWLWWLAAARRGGPDEKRHRDER
jgi:hypothetical protein